MQPRAVGGVKIRAMTQIHQQVQLLTIEAEHDGQRIDNFLKTQLKGVPKSLIYRILRKGEVRVNKKRIKPEYKLCAGDEVRVPPVRVAEKNELPSANLGSIQRLESQILFEDDAMIVLNKPSGMAVHGGSGLSFGVIEGLRALRPEARFLELVHRLDRDTSGVVLLTRPGPINQYRDQAFKQHTVQKEYLAVVATPNRLTPTGIINLRLDQHPKRRDRMTVVTRGGQHAITRYAVVDEMTGKQLVRLWPETGRTHQLRVHLAALQAPILGDRLYGPAAEGQERLLLHAYQISLPATDGYPARQFRSPLPLNFWLRSVAALE